MFRSRALKNIDLDYKMESLLAYQSDEEGDSGAPSEAKREKISEDTDTVIPLPIKTAAQVAVNCAPLVPDRVSSSHVLPPAFSV